MSTARTLEIPRMWTTIIVIAAALVIAPFAGWVVLAIWLAHAAHGLYARLVRRFGGHDHIAAFVTVALLTLGLLPVAAVLTMLVIDAVTLVARLSENARVHAVLVTLVSDGRPDSHASIGQLLLMQGERAWTIVQIVFTSAAAIVLGLVVLIAGTYAMLVEGDRWYAWAEDHVPIGRVAWRRLCDAFVETGRGLLFGVGAAGLLQAILATAAYLFLGVPQALALGLLTLVFSVVPAIGTAFVWGPVAIGLAVTGRLYEGIGLGIYGAVVIGSIDNLARPWLTRFGHLQLPGFVVLLSMFGAVELMGGWGILFGPLAVRLAKEALQVRREAVQA